MVNLYEKVLQHPNYYRQFDCNNSLITVFNCPIEARLMKTKFAGIWTQYNYLFYVVEGRKVWHTAKGSYDLQKDSCVFVRKGACILEQFTEGFCLILFFIPDEFICDTLKTKSKPIMRVVKDYDTVMPLDTSETLSSFFLSMSSYFSASQTPDNTLIELKFRELILTISDNPRNAELLSYFCSLLNEPQSVSLQRIMEENYCFNLKMEEYARLCNRSLSAFKRDFQKIYKITPGKWLFEKRVVHAKHLLTNLKKTVSEAAFDSGFENPSHFSRAFKKRFGVNPAAVRQQLI